MRGVAITFSEVYSWDTYTFYGLFLLRILVPFSMTNKVLAQEVSDMKDLRPSGRSSEVRDGRRPEGEIYKDMITDHNISNLQLSVKG